MKHGRTRGLLTLALAVVLGLSMVSMTGCAKTDDDGGDGGATETKTIKVGVQTSLTGGLADYGFAAAEGLKIAAKDFSGFEVDGTTYT
ncbi:MAG TPA: hypothetical protein VFE45_06395, partial [Coriobacteriia bacterium]|nr:hypothetical protein [Coriobacteriia bacterium]